MKRFVYILALGVLLNACAKNEVLYGSSNKKAYLQSKNGPELIVPPPLTTSNISNFYDLPNQTQDARVHITPPSVQ